MSHQQYLTILDYTKRYKTWLLVAFSIFIFTYSYFIFNFIFGNHDYNIIQGGISWHGHSLVARPLSDVAIQLTQGLYISVITPFISLLLFFISAVLFVFLFIKKHDSEVKIFFFVLSFVLYPTLIGRMYYEGACIGHNLAMVVLLIGCHTILFSNKKIYIILSTICFYFVLSCSQVFINTIWTIFLLMIAFSIISNKDINFRGFIISNVISVIAYFGTIKLFGLYGKGYNTTLATTGEFLGSFIKCLSSHIDIFYKTQPPFIMLEKIILIIIACIAIFNIIKLANSKKKKIILLLCFVLLFISHNPSGYISGRATAHSGQLRIDYHSIPLIFSFLVIFCFNFRMRKIYIVTCSVLVFLLAVSDCRALQIWKTLLDREQFYCNRLISRIEMNINFDIKKSYNYIQIGNRPSHSESLIKKHKIRTLELQRPFHHGGNQEGMLKYINPYLKIKSVNGKSKIDAVYKYKEKLSNAKAYPSKDSIFIIDNNIFVILDLNELKRILRNK